MINIDYLYHPDVAKNHFSKNYFSDKKLGFQVIEHGTILPFKKNIAGLPNCWGYGGIIDSQNNFIRSSVLYTGLDCYSYTSPPQNQFTKAPKQSFILVCFFIYGVTLLQIIYVACGF